MTDVNVAGTAKVTDAAVAVGVRRIVDETSRRSDHAWLSLYDEGKYLAHACGRT